MSLSRIRADLGDADRVAGDLDALAPDRIFDLSAGMGDALIDAVAAGITAHFDAEIDADGLPWPELNSDYARAKARLYPGASILVRTGRLREGIPGERTIAPDSAIYTFGETEIQRSEAVYATEGDPAANRPPRKFVDLTPEAVAESDAIFDRIFEQRTPR